MFFAPSSILSLKIEIRVGKHMFRESDSQGVVGFSGNPSRMASGILFQQLANFFLTSVARQHKIRLEEPKTVSGRLLRSHISMSYKNHSQGGFVFSTSKYPREKGGGL